MSKKLREILKAAAAAALGVALGASEVGQVVATALFNLF